MKLQNVRLAVGFTIVSAAFAGCFSVHKVTIKDAQRKNVEFESSRAMQTFYEAVLAKHLPKDGKPGRVRFGQTLYSKEIRVSANLAFNDGVVAADTDGDGVISNREASTYAAIKAK